MIRFNIGLAEFDEQEGPIIDILFSNGPDLDENAQFELANLFLLSNAFMRYEKNNIIALGQSFDAIDYSSKRQNKRMALIVTIEIKNLPEKSLIKIETMIRKAVDTTLGNGILEVRKAKLKLRKIAEIIYNNLITLFSAAGEKKPKKTNTKILGILLIDTRVNKYFSNRTLQYWHTLAEKSEYAEIVWSIEKRIYCIVTPKINPRKKEILKSWLNNIESTGLLVTDKIFILLLKEIVAEKSWNLYLVGGTTLDTKFLVETNLGKIDQSGAPSGI
ncbi:MAG: hypothetical protein ACP6IQ_00565 [Candidatus Njordarchaeia archaeon]